MKPFAFYRTFAAAYLGAVAAASLMACATMRDHSAAVELVVSQGIMRYIEHAPEGMRAARASDVIQVAEKLRAVASNDIVSVTELAALAAASLRDDLSPADRSLALSVINVTAQELKLKLGEGVLKPEDTASVRSLLDSIAGAAALYTR